MIEPVTLVEEWVYRRLAGSPAVADAVMGQPGAPHLPRIFPTIAPTDIVGPHISHDGAGWTVAQTTSGRPTMWTALWDVTFWANDWDRIGPLRPIAVAALDALVGEDGDGVQDDFAADDGTLVAIGCRYGEPIQAPPDLSVGVWQRIVHRVVVDIARR